MSTKNCANLNFGYEMLINRRLQSRKRNNVIQWVNRQTVQHNKTILTNSTLNRKIEKKKFKVWKIHKMLIKLIQNKLSASCASTLIIVTFMVFLDTSNGLSLAGDRGKLTHLSYLSGTLWLKLVFWSQTRVTVLLRYYKCTPCLKFL